MAVYATIDLNIPGYDKPTTNFWGHINPYQYQLITREGVQPVRVVDVVLFVLHSDDVVPYGEECPNHHLRCNVMKEDQEEFVREAAATKKWQATMDKHFPDLKKWELPEMKFHGDNHDSRATVLSNEDLMTNFIIPKLEYDDGMSVMETCKRWGKIMAQSFLKPDENFVYQNSLLYYHHTYWSGWYGGRIEEKGKRIVYFCTCETWDEYADEGEQAYWLGACSDDEFEDNPIEREKFFRFKKYSNKFKPRPKLSTIRPKDNLQSTYIAKDDESYVHLQIPLFYHLGGIREGWPGGDLCE